MSIQVTTEMTADYLTAEYGTYLDVWEDGRYSLHPGSETPIYAVEPYATVKVPGIFNLDSTMFWDGYAHQDESGEYVETATGRIIGDLRI